MAKKKDKKNQKPKIRRTWSINPKTRVKPITKKNDFEAVCHECNGLGTVQVWEGKDLVTETCGRCGGTGLL